MTVTVIDAAARRSTEAPARPQDAARPLGAADLRDLMSAFNDTTLQLQRTHDVLQREVARLQRELAEANARVRRSEALAALGEMAAGIAHEIRNPLAALQLNAQALSEDLRAVPDQQALCEKMRRAVSNIDAIVRDVLLFARDMRVRPEPTTPRELVLEALQQCEALVATAGVEVHADLSGDGARPIDADRCLTVQAIGNVVRNAVEAMAEADAAPRRLELSVRRRRERAADGASAPHVVIAVEDSGPGIPPDVVARMFNPFFTTRATGTGLGLAIVHRIVDAHGGHVAVGRADRGGARVELCMPDRTPVPVRPRRPPVPAGGSREDHP